MKVYNTTTLADKYVQVRSREQATLCNPYLKIKKLMMVEGGYMPSSDFRVPWLKVSLTIAPGSSGFGSESPRPKCNPFATVAPQKGDLRPSLLIPHQLRSPRQKTCFWSLFSPFRVSHFSCLLQNLRFVLRFTHPLQNPRLQNFL